MAELIVSEELHVAVTGLSAAEGLTVEEYLKKALRTVRFIQKEWSQDDPAPDSQDAEQTTKEETEIIPWVKVGDTLIKNKVVKSLYMEFIRHVGCRRIFDHYPEDARQMVFNHLPQGKDQKNYVNVSDGRYMFWVYNVVSMKTVRSFISTTAQALEMDISMWDA